MSRITGGAPMMTDMISGRVQAGVDALPNSLPHIRSGAMRALAITVAGAHAGAARCTDHGRNHPGLRGHAWTGIGAPRGTPPEIVERLNREINAGLQDPALLKRFADVGGVPIRATPAELTADDRQATPRNGPKVVKAAGLQPE